MISDWNIAERDVSNKRDEANVANLLIKRTAISGLAELATVWLTKAKWLNI